MARSISTSIPNPDDATNGFATGARITVTAYQTEQGERRIRVNYQGDPDGDWDVPFSSFSAGDRTTIRSAVLAILAAFKTARGYV